jgi:hypothetical protein
VKARLKFTRKGWSKFLFAFRTGSVMAGTGEWVPYVRDGIVWPPIVSIGQLRSRRHPLRWRSRQEVRMNDGSNGTIKPGDRFTIGGLKKAELTTYRRMGIPVRDGLVHGVIGAVVSSKGKSSKAPPAR